MSENMAQEYAERVVGVSDRGDVAMMCASGHCVVSDEVCSIDARHDGHESRLHTTTVVAS